MRRLILTGAFIGLPAFASPQSAPNDGQPQPRRTHVGSRRRHGGPHSADDTAIQPPNSVRNLTCLDGFGSTQRPDVSGLSFPVDDRG
jgi:hypothetical protein